MRKLLASTTALSVAISPLGTLPSFGQALNDDGSITGADGAVLCVSAADPSCDLAAIIEALKAADPAAGETLEAQLAARAEADAAAAAQQAADEAAAADAAAAEAAAQAEAEAQAAAEAEAAAQAEADAAAQAQAEAEAAAAAEAEAAAQAEADAAAQAAADEAAAAEAAAQAQAEAEAQAADAAAAEAAAAEAAAQAAADEAAAAAAQQAADEAAAAEAAAAAEEPAVEESVAEEPVAEEPVAEEPATEEPVAEEPVTEEPVVIDPAVEDPVAEEPVVVDPAAGDPVAEEPVVVDPAAEDPAAEAPAEEAAAEIPADAVIDTATGEVVDPEVAAAAVAAAEAELETDGGEIVDPAAGLKVAEPDPALLAEPVEAPVVSEAEVESLTQLLTADPTAIDPSSLAAAELVAAPPAEGESADATPVPEADPASLVAEVTETLTEANTRTSAQEFAAAPVALADGKKSGLSDLEKAGLLVLGALAVGAIIKNNRAAAATDTTVSTMGPQDSRVVSNTGDRVIVLQPDGTYRVLKDDDTVIRRPGSTVRTETFRDGSTRTIVERQDGTQVVTIRDATGRVLRRATYDDLGREVILIDDLAEEEVVVIRDLPKPKKRIVISSKDEDAALKRELAALEADRAGRKFSLRQIREIPEVRALAATIDVEPVTFASGSAAVAAKEARNLADLGRVMQELLDENPREVFLIEGHTDATGKAAMNLALSDRRAESVALALTEYFDIPPENMVVQGYGETELLIDTQESEAANRRVEVRVITPLMRTTTRG
jgi:outer membrane protein OmpA-like peptidoglycan-associated protein